MPLASPPSSSSTCPSDPPAEGGGGGNTHSYQEPLRTLSRPLNHLSQQRSPSPAASPNSGRPRCSQGPPRPLRSAEMQGGEPAGARRTPQGADPPPPPPCWPPGAARGRSRPGTAATHAAEAVAPGGRTAAGVGRRGGCTVPRAPPPLHWAPRDRPQARPTGPLHTPTPIPPHLAGALLLPPAAVFPHGGCATRPAVRPAERPAGGARCAAAAGGRRCPGGRVSSACRRPCFPRSAPRAAPPSGRGGHCRLASGKI